MESAISKITKKRGETVLTADEAKEIQKLEERKEI